MLWADSCLVHSTGKPGNIIQASLPCQIEGQGSPCSGAHSCPLTAGFSLLGELGLRTESGCAGQALGVGPLGRCALRPQLNVPSLILLAWLTLYVGWKKELGPAPCPFRVDLTIVGPLLGCTSWPALPGHFPLQFLFLCRAWTSAGPPSLGMGT